MDAILENAERLISDARFMVEAGRHRTAGSLVALGIEQLGAYIETISAVRRPDARIAVEMFGTKPNAHARRQDTLASQVNGYLYARLCARKYMELRVAETGSNDFDELQDWMLNSWPKPKIQLMAEDTEFMDSIQDLISSGKLKTMREHGFYNNAECKQITDTEVERALDIATRLTSIVAENRKFFPLHYPND